ncbi:MAG: cyclic nucleotide-binding domain-containing protein [Snowella sp.]|nr:cyclic nucleotide-binding domain-containing protein [Snowella sp.]
MTAIKNILLQIIQTLDAITLNIGQTTISLLTVIQGFFYFLLIFILTHYFNALLKNKLLYQIFLEKGIRNIIANLISYTIGTFAFIIILQSTGFNISSLAVLGGALGIGIGLGLQDLTKNFVSGLTILVEQKIKIGDFIQFGNYAGYVREISPRAVVIRLKDGSSVILPSSQLIENQVVNYHYETESVRLTVPIGVSYDTDPLLVTETLMLAAYNQCYILKDPPAQVIFKDFGDNALNFELWVWIKGTNIGINPEILSSLRFIIEYYFRLNEIVIAFPQQDLWLKNPDAIADAIQTAIPQKEIPGIETPIIPPQELDKKSQKIYFHPSISIRETLRSVPYFHDLSELEIRQMLEVGRLRKLKVGEILFREGDLGDAFYIVLSGSVEIFTEKLGKTLAKLEAGSFFGELALMLGTLRTATVKSLEDTVLFGISHHHFEQLLQANPDFQLALIKELSQHQEELMQRKQELAERGLLSQEEDDSNVITWMQKRLKILFNL